MAKGVKKIKQSSGLYYPKLSVEKMVITIQPDQFMFFAISEWYSGTTEQEKNKSITWLWQEYNRKTIVRQKILLPSQTYGVKLAKKDCGPYLYYLEASLSGKASAGTEGLYFRGHCIPKITASKWCATADGEDQRENYFKYGHRLYLGLETEGLNGETNLTVEIYKKIAGGGGLADDKLIQTFTSVDVINGEVNLKIGSTANWFIHAKKDIEEFYVKVKSPAGQYVTDGKDAIHARFLKIKKEQVTKSVEPPTNQTPVKVGETERTSKIIIRVHIQ